MAGEPADRGCCGLNGSGAFERLRGRPVPQAAPVPAVTGGAAAAPQLGAGREAEASPAIVASAKPEDDANILRDLLSAARAAALSAPDDVAVNVFFVLKDIAAAQAGAGLLDDAVETVRAIETFWTVAPAFAKDDALSLVAPAAARFDAQRAAELADGIADRPLRTSAFAKMAARRADSGDLPGAKVLLARAVRECDAIPDPSDKIHALKEIAPAQARLGDFEGAYKTAGTIGSGVPGVDLNTRRATSRSALAGIASVQLEAGDSEGARQTVTRIRGGDTYANSILYNIALAQAASWDIRAARNSAAQIDSSFFKARASARILAAAGSIGDGDTAGESMNRAVTLAGRLPDKMGGAVLADVAVAWAEFGQTDTALQVIGEIRKGVARVSRAPGFVRGRRGRHRKGRAGRRRVLLPGRLGGRRGDSRAVRSGPGHATGRPS